MRKRIGYVMGVIIAIGIAAGSVRLICTSTVDAEAILAAFEKGGDCGGLTIEYPLDETLFPADICAPTFRWKDDNDKCDTWVIGIEFEGGSKQITALSEETEWTPKQAVWETVKKGSMEKEAEVIILGVECESPKKILSAGKTTISTSRDAVGAPIFYREVNLPFIDAVKNPSLIRWRFGTVSSPKQPPVVLEGVPVCGNCHSFSRRGDTLAMDVDYANSKGSYIITKVAKEMVLRGDEVITWNDYKKEDGEQTFGLLSQISPDGRFVVSTVKDKSVFVPQPDLAFSQLFFPIKGILCIYDRAEGVFRALPGADDPNYVQSNPTWSPDGKYIVFAKTKAYDLRDMQGKGKVLLNREECREFTEEGKPFKFDLYRIPFNGGQGGKAEPIAGASNNGKSNYFARYSPDGKWIVFCQAANYMLLQPDSELHIIPAEGGDARRLRANTRRMNSWHSFSPNGKWLVFSSKTDTAYTQLFLTHINDEGKSTPAIALSHFTSPDRAANIPEFLNSQVSAIKRIQGAFLDDYSYLRAGDAFFRAGDADNAIEEYKKTLELNPKNAAAHRQLGFLFYNAKGMQQLGMEHYRKSLECDPKDARTHHDIGMAYLNQGKFERAAKHLSNALEGMPQGLDKQYNLVNMRYSLGHAMLHKGDLSQAEVYLSGALELSPQNAHAHYLLSRALAGRWKLDEALKHYRSAVSLNPRIDTSAGLHDLFAMNYSKQSRFREAAVSAEKALNLALAANDQRLAQQISGRLQTYRQKSGGLLKR